MLRFFFFSLRKEASLTSRQAIFIKVDGVPGYVSEKSLFAHQFKLKELAIL